jgi:hypothetical protein
VREYLDPVDEVWVYWTVLLVNEERITNEVFAVLDEAMDCAEAWRTMDAVYDDDYGWRMELAV